VIASAGFSVVCAVVSTVEGLANWQPRRRSALN